MTATIAQVRTGLKNAVATTGVRTAEYLQAAPNPTIAMITSPDVAYDEAFAGEATYQFRIILVASRADEERGQQAIDKYLEPAGSTSIAAAVHADATLGGLVDDTRVSAARAGIAEWAGTDMYQAEFDVEVYL